MRVTINGIEYESVDTKIVDGMDVSCRDCDIFKAKILKSLAEYPLCYETGSGKARMTCYSLACKGIKRIWKKV